ncbi:2'-5' RNA ligase [Melghirimyces profundicolus]|uniref:RNA 2',3'-cyclic phosphodiesterase n=1 Tax=Melghirimyces profundicolus TaxID=1242148 RepID=A0A2T6BW45_9BACL|nr:RNA 2',3'-cyclic phosphodiesterase [Melghirimyces profundicolus]PTX60283.1 2'-5' RNA ligase [Melghirimyces profundicolus]
MGSNPLHRLFIALPLPGEQKELLAHWSGLLSERWPFKKWVHPSDYHITVQFLGPCTFRQRRKVKNALKELAPGLEPFRLRIDGIGHFGVKTRPRILWAGVDGELNALHHLHDVVIDAVESLGFEREKRPYRPHITLAKKYKYNDFPYESMNRVFSPDPDRCEWTVRELILYETHIYRSPMYHPLAAFRLGE